MKILLNGKGSLEELFAELGAVDYNLDSRIIVTR